MRQPDPADGITRQTAVSPSFDAAPVWENFLREATNGDVEMIRFLKQWCGYSLTGDTREHALLFVYGPGGNGKSVFLNTVAGILGDYATTAGMDTFAATRSDRHPTDLAALRGARFVSASETEEGRAWAEARIKAMTGGDLISARFMRRDFFTYKPQFKLTIVGNHKPVLRNVDEAARRRFNIVPFEYMPASPDLALEERLKAEWPAILGWMIEGCADWHKNGLLRPERVAAATAAYFGEQDIFGHWLEDECIAEPGNQHRWEPTASEDRPSSPPAPRGQEREPRRWQSQSREEGYIVSRPSGSPTRARRPTARKGALAGLVGVRTVRALGCNLPSARGRRGGSRRFWLGVEVSAEPTTQSPTFAGLLYAPRSGTPPKWFGWRFK